MSRSIFPINWLQCTSLSRLIFFRIKIQKTSNSIIGDDNDDHKVINSVDIDYSKKKLAKFFFNFQDFTSYHESPDILKFVRLAINVQL